jgi:phosphoenolpyruvate carboxykinase (ATP)
MPERRHLHAQFAPNIHRNLPTAELAEACIMKGARKFASNGAVVAYTGKYTGRTPKDKRIVREAETEAQIWWDGNAPMEAEEFDALHDRAQEVIDRSEVYIIDAFAGADPAHRLKVRVIVQSAYHALFIKQLLIRPTRDELLDFEPDWVVVDLPEETYEREENGEMRDAIIALSFERREVVIMGTKYAGEMKKSVFSVMNFLLPNKGIMPMHCSANIGQKGDVALFFGLSGTGKTTLSADPERGLIGDDEHGWSDSGVFNFEGGCYAKCIKLTREGEPEIFDAIRFGSVLENVVLNPDRTPDYFDGSLTENTRCAYPLEHISNAVFPSIGGHPDNIIFLTADAYGVLPPISRLTAEQAMYHFLNGYTAKVAGTEAGVKEPQATFSTCFGAPFMVHKPKVYAELLAKKIQKHKSRVWLVNTGWSGGPYGTGHRMELKYTRAMIRAALAGSLDKVETVEDPVFGLAVPVSCPGVPGNLLMPKQTWPKPQDYDAAAAKLKAMFDANYEKYQQ